MTDQLAAVLLFIVPVPAAGAIHVGIDVVIGWFASAPDALDRDANIERLERECQVGPFTEVLA